jgi:hypothetical protein
VNKCKYLIWFIWRSVTLNVYYSDARIVPYIVLPVKGEAEEDFPLFSTLSLDRRGTPGEGENKASVIV